MIVVCGEALIDLTPVDCDGSPALAPRPGGSPYNVAVGLGRLGIPVAFAGAVSRDLLGRLLVERLAASGVETRLLRLTAAPSPLAVVGVEADGHPSYSFYVEGTALAEPLAAYDLPAGAVEALHVGSLGMVLEPGASAAADLLRRTHGRALTTLDPNVRPSFVPDRAAYLRRLDEWLAHTDVVKVSDEDLGWLYPGEDPLEVAAGWLDRGPALAVVTRGAQGAWAVTGTRTALVAGKAVVVADTVGAGDAFTSGLLCWLAEHDALDRSAVAGLGPRALDEALRFAVAAAAATCERPGADPPTRERLRE